MRVGFDAEGWVLMVAPGDHQFCPSSKHNLFFSGDTGLCAEYVDIRRRLSGFDLVLLEVGAFHESWANIHLGPEHALEALSLLGGGALLPVHWGTFNLALHAWDEPAETLVRLAPERAARLIMPMLGEAAEPVRVEGVEPWWHSVAEREAKTATHSIEASEKAPSLPPLSDGAGVQWPLD